MDIDGAPVVLNRFTGVKNNKTYKIRIEHVTRNLMDDVVDHMTKYFLMREPITSYAKLASEPASLRDMQKLWRHTIEQGASMVAILENENSGTPQNIVGANVTGIAYKNEPGSSEIKGEAQKKVLNLMIDITNEANLFERYGVDKYLTAYGLSVHPDYHGLGIGYKLLETREPLCKAIGLKLTATVFTAAASQHLASKVGFQTLAEHYFKDYIIDGVIYFPELEGNVVLMAKAYS